MATVQQPSPEEMRVNALMYEIRLALNNAASLAYLAVWDKAEDEAHRAIALLQQLRTSS